jgi:hypothetical protein
MNMLESLLAITVAITTVLTAAGLGVKWLTKHYFDELKPNGGSSIKDQVNRLEQQHKKLEAKVDKIYDAIVENSLKSNSKKSK